MNDFSKDMKEVMDTFDAKRAEWFEKFGTYEGFDAWFSKQVGF